MAQSIQIKDRTTNSNIVVNADGSINSVVSGTVTATPTGTQDVSIVNPTVFPVTQTAPVGSNFYSIAFSAVAGQAGNPYNFLSLFNPLGSGKSLVLQVSFILPWASGATTVFNSMETFRTTAASAGTLTSGASINKLNTTSPNSVAEVRTVNPTITATGTTLGGIPPVVSTTGAGVGASGNFSAPSGATFIMAPGQGICMRQVVAGDADQLWNLGFLWSEV